MHSESGKPESSTQLPSFLLVQLPLVLSGLVYWCLAAVCLLVPLDGVEPEMRVLIRYGGSIICGVLGIGALVVAAIARVKSSFVYIILFVITIAYVPSAFLPLGVPMLIFIIRKESREYYGVGF